MNFKQFITTIFFLVFVLIGLFIGVNQFGKIKVSEGPLGSPEVNWFQSGVTNSSVSVGVSSTDILSANSARQYALITNDHASAVMYLFLGSTPTANKGIRLNAAGGSYEITPDNLYVGKVTGIATATGTALIVEK